MAARAFVKSHIVQALVEASAAPLSDRDLLARFAAGRDQAAFAVLVARYTGMVLGVCRRLLARPQDAEDACQAVFLLLAEKAGSSRWQSSIAGWLYATARNVARNARVAADRRTRRERHAAVPEAVSVVDAVSGRELIALLDEELDRLPPRYRDPLILCYLEGLTRDEAADRLHVSRETLKSQLKRGRQKLADALAARGVELGAVLLALAAASVATSSRTLRDSLLAAAAGSPSRAAATLARSVTMTGYSTTRSAALLAAVCLVAAVGVGIAPVLSSPEQPRKDEVKQAAEKPSEPTLVRFGATRFRATQRLGDARYGAGGKRIVGFGGGQLFVWDAHDGTLLRTIETKLGPLNDPIEHDLLLAFAVHPRKSWVACGGLRDGKAQLQVWDFETGERLAETVSPCDALKVLAWTPDGGRLLERANVGREEPTAWKLIVRDEQLQVLREHDLPGKFGHYSTVMHPLPGGKQVLLWQNGREPAVFDLETGNILRTLDFKPSIPSDLCISPDGKTVLATHTSGFCLLNFADGQVLRTLPVLRDGWEKPRPLFSPDSKTVYVYDHRPVAYDVATGKELWRAWPRTFHTVRMDLCDLSPDGSTLLIRCGHAVSLLDTATGAERNRTEAPALPTGFVWSPDGTKVFTRRVRQDRTWTAWDTTSGKRLYDLQPSGFVANEDWKMLPGLFFLGGGKELAVCLERKESTETVGPKEFLVFDAATGRCVRRLGKPLPKEIFQWMHPMAVDPAGKWVLMQQFAVSALPAGPGGAAMFDRSQEFTFKNIRWDPVQQTRLQEWDVRGERIDLQQHFAPHNVTLSLQDPDYTQPDMKLAPARIRCYSLADGKLVHEMQTEFSGTEPDRIQGHFLLAYGFNSKWIKNGNNIRYAPLAPFAYDLWELPSRGSLRLFELDEPTPIALGPSGQYVLRVVDDHTCEVFEPFVLKRAVVRITTPCRPAQFEFSPDGGRVAVSFADTTLAIWDTAPWRKQLEEQLAQAVPVNLAPLWDDLAKDPAKGLRAARLLSVAGDRAVALLREKVVPPRTPDEARIKQLIADLDSPDFDTREKAEKELRALSVLVESSLRKELQNGPSAEVRRRLQSLLQSIEERSLTTEEVRAFRAVQALAWMKTEEARTQLAKWAGGEPGALLTRMAREALAR